MGSSVKFEVPPGDVARALGRDIVATARTSVILLPTLLSGTQPVAVRSVTGARARAVLRGELRVPVGAPWGEPWIAPRRHGAEALARDARRRLDDLIDRHPVRTVSVGTARLRTDPKRVADELLAAARWGVAG